MKIAVILALAAAGGAASSASATLVAYWNFNAGLSNGALFPTPISATQSIGNAGVLRNLNVTASNILALVPSGASAHNGLNALNSDPDGNDLAIQNGTSGVNNGKSMTFEMSTLGVQDIVLTMAARRTTSGFSSIDFSTSTDGTNFTFVGTLTGLNSSAYSLATFDLSAANSIENVALAYVRVTFQGTGTSAAGNVRIDNVQFNGTPAPGALGLLGIGGLVAARRRRA